MKLINFSKSKRKSIKDENEKQNSNESFEGKGKSIDFYLQITYIAGKNVYKFFQLN
jgi:hypothetical protein